MIAAEDLQTFHITIGNCEQLMARIDAELKEVESRVGDFENRYKKVMRPLLSSRALILPKDLKDPSTLILLLLVKNSKGSSPVKNEQGPGNKGASYDLTRWRSRLQRRANRESTPRRVDDHCSPSRLHPCAGAAAAQISDALPPAFHSQLATKCCMPISISTNVQNSIL